MDMVKLQRDLARFLKELETEDRLVRVGLKDKLQSAAIYKKHSKLYSSLQIKKLNKLKSETAKPEEKEILERAYFFLVGCAISQKLASEYDQLTTFYSSAKVRFKSKQISYYEVIPLLSKEPVFTTREILDDLALSVVARGKQTELKLLRAEIKDIKTMGFEGYVDFAERAKGLNYAKFEVVVKEVLQNTNTLWKRSANDACKQVLGKPFGNLRSCHMAYMRSISAFDNYFPKEKIVSTFKRFAKDIGAADLLGSIKIDDSNRPKKNPRAVCYWIDPPHEVHLIIKPVGGETDYEAVLHEGGHALHAASVDASLPHAFRVLPRSNALTEAYAFILEDLVFEPAWLAKYLNVDAQTGAKINLQALFVNLMLLRKYLGKFLYEYEMFSSGDFSKAPDLYSKVLLNTTGFVHSSDRYLNDLDSSFYCADYLRAWIGAAQIKDYFKRKFGKEWFFNPKAGKFMRYLWRDGVKEDLEDVVTKLGYKAWDSSYLMAGYSGLVRK